MSNPFGFGGGIVIHQDVSENPAGQGLRKTKREDLQGKPPANKRAALGTITNTGTTRVQPSRAVKLGISTDGFGSNNENVQGKSFSVPVQSQPFTIHVDNASDATTKLPVHQTNISSTACSESLQSQTTLDALRKPLSSIQQPIILDDSSFIGSPMVLDTSVADSHYLELSKEDRLNCVLTVPEYTDDIFQYLRLLENKHRPKPQYMRRQPDITNSMRCILVDWLVEVAEEYKLHRETLFLSVNYIDRFLSQMSVLRGKLQLVGAASMFLAAKYEEIYPPEVGEFVYITDDTYTKKQVLRMEHLILKVLSFDVAVPTINCFCERFVRDADVDDKTKSLAMYLTELTLIEAEPYLSYLPSEIAAAAVCLALHTFGHDAMPKSLAEKSGYELGDLENVMRDLHKTMCNAPSHAQQAICEKYRQSKFQLVSTAEPPSDLPGGISLEKVELVEL